MTEREKLEASLTFALLKTFEGTPQPWTIRFEDLGMERRVENDAEFHQAVHDAVTMIMDRRNQ